MILIINSDNLEDFSEEFAIDEKEKKNFFENLSLELNYDNNDDSLTDDNNDMNLNDDGILSKGVNERLNNPSNKFENSYRKEVNIEEVLKNRGVLNIFSLNKEKYHSLISMPKNSNFFGE